MNNRRIIALVIISALCLGLLCTVHYITGTYDALSRPCAFCNQTIIEQHKICETDACIVLCDSKPIEPHHMLVIPKRHIQEFEDLNDAEIHQTSNLIKRINTALEKKLGKRSYLILQKNGGEVGQTVPHVHFHYISVEQKTNTTPRLWLLWSFVRRLFQSTMSHEERTREVQFLRDAINTL